MHPHAPAIHITQLSLWWFPSLAVFPSQQSRHSYTQNGTVPLPALLPVFRFPAVLFAHTATFLPHSGTRQSPAGFPRSLCHIQDSLPHIQLMSQKTDWTASTLRELLSPARYTSSKILRWPVQTPRPYPRTLSGQARYLQIARNSAYHRQ